MQNTFLTSYPIPNRPSPLSERRLEAMDAVLWAAYRRSDRATVFRTLLERIIRTRNGATS